MKNTDLVTICYACLTASCYQGKFYCEDYRTAKTIKMCVKDLKTLAYEHSDNWEKDSVKVDQYLIQL